MSKPMNENADRLSENGNVLYEDPGENTLTLDWASDRGEVEMTLNPGHYEVEEDNAVPVSIDVDPDHLPYLASKLLELYGKIKGCSPSDEILALLEARVDLQKKLDMAKGYEEMAASDDYKAEVALRRANRKERRLPASALLD